MSLSPDAIRIRLLERRLREANDKIAVFKEDRDFLRTAYRSLIMTIKPWLTNTKDKQIINEMIEALDKRERQLDASR